MLIAGSLNLESPLLTTWGEIFSAYMGYFVLGFAGVVLPLLILWVLYIDTALLNEETFVAKWGVLYEKLKANRYGRTFYLVYMVRRLTLVILAFRVKDHAILQLLPLWKL